MPTMFSGRLATLAIPPMGSALVLLASTAWGGRTSSNCWTIVCFRPRSSKTASITMSARAKCSRQRPSWSSCSPTTRAPFRQASWFAIRRRCTFLRQAWSSRPCPRPTAAASRSFSSTLNPFSALTCAMPAPMSPAPSTPTVLTGTAGLPKRFFFRWVIPLKMPMSASDSGVAASSANRAASYSSAPSRGLPYPFLTQSRMANGAGYLPAVFFCTISPAFLKITELSGVSSRSQLTRDLGRRFTLYLGSCRSLAIWMATGSSDGPSTT
mmetsp:Transcript_30822/g.53300  ORF Transcript_30822/g.53300 Transcript_30822/m.53300 type:complete len:268 (+) Transcript_30822:944-1747(+)